MRNHTRVFLIIWLFLLSLCGASAGEDAVTDLVSRAKKEGKVVWYTTLTTPEARKLAAMFEGRYPFSTVEIFRTNSGALTNRIFNEYRAKRYAVDVIMGTGSRGGVPSLKKEGIITPYSSPELKFVDKDAQAYTT
jgi:iron(III) transport system substrate-binding protein